MVGWVEPTLPGWESQVLNSQDLAAHSTVICMACYAAWPGHITVSAVLPVTDANQLIADPWRSGVRPASG